MPKTVTLPEKRDVKLSLNVTHEEIQELRREAMRRYPITPAQLAYERYCRGRKAVCRG